jgi:hypothetical protein
MLVFTSSKIYENECSLSIGQGRIWIKEKKFFLLGGREKNEFTSLHSNVEQYFIERSNVNNLVEEEEFN